VPGNTLFDVAILDDRTLLVPLVDERDARRTLREQIARLEGDLVVAATSSYPRLPLPAVRRRGGPRLLSLGELEQIRDEMAGRVADVRAARMRVADDQADKRLTLERMLLEPGEYKWTRISANDIGEEGCKHWHVRPRLGLVGMLAGWWHVKVSSGCPLAWGPWRTLRPRTFQSMGKRSRKRADGPVRTQPRQAPAPVRSTAPGVKGRVDRFIEAADQRPKAPWHPFPLIELSVLAGLALIIIGAINSDTDNGKLAIFVGLALAALAGLDTAVRDHFSGFRSHSTLLAGFPAALVGAVAGFLGPPLIVVVFIAAGVFVAAFFALRNAFKRRAGVGFKV
jgi:hypothetical protein